MPFAVTPKGREVDIKEVPHPSGYPQRGPFYNIFYQGVLVAAFGNNFNPGGIAEGLKEADRVIDNTGLKA